MRTNTRNKSFLVKSVLAILMFVMLTSSIFFTGKEVYISLILSLLGCTYYLYIGLDSLWKLPPNQRQWYTQPSLFVGMSMFLYLIYNFLRINILHVLNSITIERIIGIFGILFFVIAVVLWCSRTFNIYKVPNNSTKNDEK